MAAILKVSSIFLLFFVFLWVLSLSVRVYRVKKRGVFVCFALNQYYIVYIVFFGFIGVCIEQVFLQENFKINFNSWNLRELWKEARA